LPPIFIKKTGVLAPVFACPNPLTIKEEKSVKLAQFI
tara:strand:- start:535 stop:645 length:111 start_codon:yes stop_codon:yes gene_type:complete